MFEDAEWVTHGPRGDIVDLYTYTPSSPSNDSSSHNKFG
jgi:hypothetical protein